MVKSFRASNYFNQLYSVLCFFEDSNNYNYREEPKDTILKRVLKLYPIGCN